LDGDLPVASGAGGVTEKALTVDVVLQILQ
jgi:hypothetical protein